MKKIFFKIFQRILSPFFRIKKRIFFVNFNFNQYSDSPRAISEKMSVLFPDYELVWLFRNDSIINSGIIPTNKKTIVKKYSHFNFIKYLASSFCVINNFEYTWMFYKKRKQFFIQTYHGDRGFKKVLLMEGYSLKNIRDKYLTDLCVSGSDFSENITYRKAFDYAGEILKVGIPRNDILVNGKHDCSNIYKFSNVSPRKKIILYLPTFRDSNNGFFDNKVNLKQLLKYFGNEYQICFRLHKAIKKTNIVESENIIDVTGYYDVMDLLCAADILITDYSSCAGDFALTGKPIVLTLFDYDEYTKSSRELQGDILHAGLKIAFNMDDLINVFNKTTSKEFQKCDDDFLKYFGTHETGNSSERVCKIINEEYHKRFQ